jgi:hypothetical protein
MTNPALLQDALIAADRARIADDEPSWEELLGHLNGLCDQEGDATSDAGFPRPDPIRYLDFEPIGREPSGGGLFHVAVWFGGEEGLCTGIVLYGPDLPDEEHDNL